VDLCHNRRGATYVTGVVTSPDRRDSGDLDAAVAKLSRNGSVAWVRKLPEGTTFDRDVGRAIEVHKRGAAAVVWEPESSWPGRIIRLTSSGRIAWATKISLVPSDVAVDAAGRTYVAGDGGVVALSAAGVLRDKVRLGGKARAIDARSAGLSVAGERGDVGRVWRLTGS
jgi:hypothetical protein